MRHVLLSLAAAAAVVYMATLAFSQAAPNGGPDSAHIMQLLNGTISWYRNIGSQQQVVSDANDANFVNANRQIAEETMRLAFEFARGQAEPASGQGRSALNAARGTGGNANSETAGGESRPYQSLLQLQAKQDRETQETQAEVDGIRQKLATATGATRQKLQSQLAETEAEVNLSKARGDAIRNMVQFLNGAGARTADSGLRAQIEALARSVPLDLTTEPAGNENNKTGTKQPATAADTTSPATTAQIGSPGIWEASANVLSLWGKQRVIDAAIQQTGGLSRNLGAIRLPMVAQLRDLTKQGDELAQEADSADPATLDREKKQLDAMTEQFNQINAAADPLNKMAILLDMYQKNLANWRIMVHGLLMTGLKGLLARVGLLIVVLALVVSSAELWRKATYRYVHDPRRRHQFLLLRKFVLWFVIAIIVAFSFASRLGSMATFAGLLTAGVAVALQSVILSVVGYFFLIGKYGIRSGDRVQIGGVTGEVIDVGLVRIHLMELGGAGASTPTGRVVAFSNATVFQPSTGLFKQIPGTHFGWHEITLTLPAEADYATTKDRMIKAVEAGLADYKDEIARQHRAIESEMISAPGDGLRPAVQIRFTSSGLEAVVRFPVDLRHAAEIDERVMRELLSHLELTHSGSANIRVRTESASG